MPGPDERSAPTPTLTPAPTEVGSRAPILAGRVLMVAYHFPPLGGMGSRRAVRFAERLGGLAWEMQVLTVRDGYYHKTETGWTPPGNVHVIRTPSLELGRVSRGVATTVLGGKVATAQEGTLTPVQVAGLGARFRALVRDGLYIPDAHVGWLPYAVREGQRVLARDQRSGPPRVIYSSSVPYTGHLVAGWLSHRANLPWVAEFRDLWIGSQARTGVPSWRNALDTRIEASIVRGADALVFTTERSRAQILERYRDVDPGRARVVTNAYEAQAHPPPEPPKPDEPFVLTHAGTLSGNIQNPRPLLEAARRVCEDTPGSMVVRLFGPPAPWVAAADEVGMDRGTIELKGTVPGSRIPEELARSSAVLILVPGERFRAVLAGKTFEWLGSGLPALVVADRDSETARIVREAGGAVLVERNEPEELLRGLRSLVDAHRKGRLTELRPSPEVARRYELAQVTGRLVDVFRQAIHRRGGGGDVHVT